MQEKNQKCMNCGHDCHCGNKCKQDVVDEFGNKYKITCCSYCRHIESENNE